MTSLIEQATQRLAQLRQAGVVIDDLDMTLDPPLNTAATPPFAAVAEPPRPVATSKRVDLDFAALERNGIVTPTAPRSRIADQFRVIKRPLIRNAMASGESAISHGNLIMVTSALAGEGKSFTSLNLAISIAAELDHTVMLVDADVARPSILPMLGLPPSRGLLDVLEDSAELSSVLLKTNVDKLTILPSGTAHPRATELLASDAMRQLLHDIATRYPDRIVIFDSPPLLLTTEARVLASHMGQVVVVVQAERTLQSDVQSALATIESCPVRLMLLNRAQTDSRSAYGYGYGAYGYGYGREAGKQPA
jgi:exopolysaccharide/PEP-CTERM locus tyrosine autokinase